MKNKIIKIMFLTIFVHLSGVLAEPLLKDINNIALNGYDAVSYFREKLAIKGETSIYVKQFGAIWCFRDSSNLKTFNEKPEHFIPEYGGFCSYGTKNGELIESDPQVFSIIENKLYFITDIEIRKKWRDDLSNNIEKANKKWEKIKIKKDPKIKKREIELASE